MSERKRIFSVPGGFARKERGWERLFLPAGRQTAEPLLERERPVGRLENAGILALGRHIPGNGKRSAVFQKGICSSETGRRGGLFSCRSTEGKPADRKSLQMAAENGIHFPCDVL